MRNMLLALVLVLSQLTAGVSVAQEAQELTPAQQAEGRLVLETARNLASYGETKGDALAMVMAAKMIADVPGRVLADGEQGASGANFDVEALLKKASDLAPDNEIITQLSGEVREAAEASSRAVCYWQYYCYWNGWCEYYWACF
jgi:hypothetical protein